MKHILFGTCLTLAFLTSYVGFSHRANAQALTPADRVGNGGGLWTCSEPDGSLRSADLVDLFEARQEFQLYVPNVGIGQTPLEVYQAQKSRITQMWPSFAQKLTPYLIRVESNLIFVDAALALVDDSLWRIRPLASTCAGGTWDYTQFANFTNYDRVLVRKDLWLSAKVSLFDKAGLLFHEAVYLMLRETAGDANSVRARQIVGLLFSNLSASEIQTRVQAVMQAKRPTAPPAVPTQWACSGFNRNIDTTYIGYGLNEIDATYDVMHKCQIDTTTPGYCSKTLCAPILSLNDQVSCLSKNRNSDLIYLAKGRSTLEAQTKAMMACEAAGFRSYCEVQTCSP